MLLLGVLALVLTTYMPMQTIRINHSLATNSVSVWESMCVSFWKWSGDSSSDHGVQIVGKGALAIAHAACTVCVGTCSKHCSMGYDSCLQELAFVHEPSGAHGLRPAG